MIRPLLLAAYLLGGSGTLGWLLNTHLSARHAYDRVPGVVLVLLPLLWPVMLAWGLVVLIARRVRV